MDNIAQISQVSLSATNTIEPVLSNQQTGKVHNRLDIQNEGNASCIRESKLQNVQLKSNGSHEVYQCAKESLKSSFRRKTFNFDNNNYILDDEDGRCLSLPPDTSVNEEFDFPLLERYNVTSLYQSFSQADNNSNLSHPRSWLSNGLTSSKNSVPSNTHHYDANISPDILKDMPLHTKYDNSEISSKGQYLDTSIKSSFSSDIDGIDSCSSRSDQIFERNYLNHLPFINHSYENWNIYHINDKLYSNDLDQCSGNVEYDAHIECNDNINDIGNRKPRSRIKSVILEFDPLYNVESLQVDDGLINDLDRFPLTIPSSEKCYNITNDNGQNSSLLHIESSSLQGKSHTENFDIEYDESVLNKIKSKALHNKKGNSSGRWLSVKRAIKVVSDSKIIQNKKNSEQISPDDFCTGNILEKPNINCSITVALHNGVLMKCLSSGEKPKDFAQRWCQLGKGKLSYSVEKSSFKESINLNMVLSIQMIRDHKVSSDGINVYCFEINVSSRSRPYLFGALCTTERRVWMQKLLENLTSTFSTRYSAEYIRSGWCYLKVGINGDWIPSWILLQHRTLVYTRMNGEKELVEVDLRKARFVGLQDTKEQVVVSELKPIILLDTVGQTYYLVMERPNETAEWQHVIKAASLDNGIHLVDQQLTKDDVPVIVEKCINFVYAHGSMSEGIYRRSGSNSSVTKLLSLFRQDSWAIQISRQDYTEYDVSNVLKRFFRDLPEPLIMPELRKHLCNAPAIKCSEDEKLLLYRNILEQLTPVNYVTIRKLIGHLNFIHEQREKNLMPVENLSAIWGPTLMHTENTGIMQWSKLESEAIADLILLYPKLFLIENEELERENRIRQVLEKYHNASTQLPLPKKPSGDLKVWIYLHSKDSGKCVNVTLNPNKEAGSICNELADKMDSPSHLLCLHEYICNGALMRPMHHTEHVFNVVLQWSYWDEVDRKDNYLVISNNSIIQEILPLAKPPLSVSTELKYADQKCKSFKNYLFEFSQAKLSYYKDKKGSIKIKEWKIEDIVWYIGHESKRNPHTRWAITFITKSDKQNRTRETPYFGCTIAGSNKEEQLRWIAAMLVGQYPYSNLLPSVTLLQ